MTEVGLDRFRVGAGGFQKAGAGVAEVVDPKTFGESGLLDCGVPDLASPRVRQRGGWTGLRPPSRIGRR